MTVDYISVKTPAALYTQLAVSTEEQPVQCQSPGLVCSGQHNGQAGRQAAGRARPAGWAVGATEVKGKAFNAPAFKPVSTSGSGPATSQ